MMMSLGVGPWARVRPWLPAVGALGATPDSILESGSVVQVIGLLAGRPIEDSGLVWPNEMVSEGAD